MYQPACYAKSWVNSRISAATLAAAFNSMAL
jgi:hypothetical protein